MVSGFLSEPWALSAPHPAWSHGRLLRGAASQSPSISVSLWDTRMHTCTHARTHTHTPQALCAPGSGYYAYLAWAATSPGSRTRKGVVTWQLGPSPWEASSARGWGCAGAVTPVNHCSVPSQGLLHTCETGGEGVDLAASLCSRAFIPLGFLRRRPSTRPEHGVQQGTCVLRTRP